jgi:hypothetical protein
VGTPIRPPVDPALRPVTFDAGALIAIERGASDIRALARTLALGGTPILTPAPAVAKVWRGGTGGQARLAQFLSTGIESRHVQIIDLDFEVAKEVGALLARAPMSITDGAVCRCALLARGGVVTSDPTDIGRIIPPDRIKVV